LYEPSGALHEYAGTVCISSINAALMSAVVRLFYLGPGADLEQELQRRYCRLICQSSKEETPLGAGLFIMPGTA
jgi:hypothetical protein